MAADRLYSLEGKRVWVAGHTGMVGASLCRQLAGRDCHILAVPSAELDQRRQADVEAWVRTNKPDAVIVASARVGGIIANDTLPADFIYDNLMIETNIIHASYLAGVEKLLFLGSTCIYPRDAHQPTVEDALLTGPLEPTNQWYAIAKIAGIKLCQAYRAQHGCDFISAMPTNLYGPGDNFHPEHSHVLPALMSRIHEAKRNNAAQVTVWGSGNPRREFLHVDDCARALVFLLEHYSGAEFFNVGTGVDMSIRDLATLIARIVGYEGTLTFDASRPDGAPKRLMNVDRIKALGWVPDYTVEQGLLQTYEWFLKTLGDDNGNLRGRSSEQAAAD